MSLFPFVGTTKARQYITISNRWTQQLLHPQRVAILYYLSIQINSLLSLNHLSKTKVFKCRDWLNIVGLLELMEMIPEKTVGFLFSFGVCSLRVNSNCFCGDCLDCRCLVVLEIFDLLIQHFYLVFARLLRGVTLH